MGAYIFLIRVSGLILAFPVCFQEKGRKERGIGWVRVELNKNMTSLNQRPALAQLPSEL